MIKYRLGILRSQPNKVLHIAWILNTESCGSDALIFSKKYQQLLNMQNFWEKKIISKFPVDIC